MVNNNPAYCIAYVCRLAAIAAATVFVLQVAPAQALVVSAQPNGVQVVTEGKPFAVFQRFEDVWLVAADNHLNVEGLTLAGANALNISEIEKLTVKNGVGLRLRFAGQPAMQLQQVPVGVSSEPALLLAVAQNAPAASLPPNTGFPSGAAVTALADVVDVVPLPSGSAVLQAKSNNTGEIYTVFAGNTLQPNLHGEVLGALRLLPSLSGMAMVARNGSFLTLEPQGSGVRITPAKKGFGPVFTDKTPENFQADSYLNQTAEQLAASQHRQLPQAASAFERAMTQLQAAQNSIKDVLQSPPPARRYTPTETTLFTPPVAVPQVAEQAVDAVSQAQSTAQPADTSAPMFDLTPAAPQVAAPIGQPVEPAAPAEHIPAAEERFLGLGEAPDVAQTQAPQVATQKTPQVAPVGRTRWDDSEFFAYQGGGNMPTTSAPPVAADANVDAPLPAIQPLGQGPTVAEADNTVSSYAQSAVGQSIAELYADKYGMADSLKLLPRFDDVDSPSPYIAYERYFFGKLNTAETPEGRNFTRLQLAKLALAYERYRQAEGVLLQLPQDLSGLPINPEAQILLGIARAMQGQGKEAVVLLEKNLKPDADRQLWLAMAYEQMGKHAEAAPLFTQFLEQSLEYPLHLQRALRLSQARNLYALKNMDGVNDVMRSMSMLYPEGLLPPEAKYLQAKAHLANGNDDIGENLLAEVARSNNPSVAYDAQFDFVNYLLKRGELTPETAITHLENLRFLWRGGELEQKVLRELGELYLKVGDKRKGLERLKYHAVNFPDAPENREVAKRMSDTFTHIFFGDEVGKLDPLFVLGLYYDFRELTPPGQTGDQMLRTVVKRLQDLGLFRRGIDLLSSQMKYRVKNPVEKASYGAFLAELYLLDQRYDEGLQVIENTTYTPLPQPLVQQRNLLQAKLLVANENYDKAREVLAAMPGEEAFDLLVDVLWQTEDYDTLITQLEPRFQDTEARSQNWSPRDQIYLLRLAFAYNVTRQRSKLIALESAYAAKALNPVIAQPMSFLNTDLAVPYPVKNPDPERPWQKVTDALADYNKLADQYEQFKEQRELEERKRRYFNRRMGQTTAPETKTLEAVDK